MVGLSPTMLSNAKNQNRSTAVTNNQIGETLRHRRITSGLYDMQEKDQPRDGRY